MKSSTTKRVSEKSPSKKQRVKSDSPEKKDQKRLADPVDVEKAIQELKELEDEVAKDQHSLWSYIVVLGLMVLSVPGMADLLYDRSSDFIRALKPYQTGELTKLMNWFSFLGDGEILFMTLILMAVYGLSYDYKFFAMGFAGAMHWINWLKLQFHHSRPQFDDPRLGIINESAYCSGEFGNPSGHALMASECVLTCLFFYIGQH